MAALTLDQINVGDSYSETIEFTDDRMARFIQLTGDIAGIHTSQAYSQAKGFADRVVFGFLLSLYFSRILGMELPGENTVIGAVELNFHEPVYVGDTVTYTARVLRVVRPLGAVLLALRIEKADGRLCVDGKTTCAFKR